MLRIFSLILFLGIYPVALAQDFSIGKIPIDLTDNANVLVRTFSTEFDVINPGKAIETHLLEVTILNEKGKREAQQYVHYSDLVKILSLSGELFDRNGKRVRKIKKTEIEDYSASGSNMYSDDRVKVVDFTYPTYPYTIRLEYAREHNGLMFYPTWVPQDRNTTAVEKAKFVVKTPNDLPINFYEQQVSVTKSEGDGKTIYTWEANTVAALKSEPFSPPLREQVPLVMVTPSKFEMEGYSGSMDTWESIGAYEHKLLAGTQAIPTPLEVELDALIKGVDDKMERARLIYQYVQNTTRYVSVQLGIGGWKPYDVKYVYENGYGDCKALTNYTMALLDFAGIESIYTSVYAGNGEPDIITAFPNARFNHVFLAVPIEKDTVWLECTSQTNPFGYLGNFTSDRHVLMTTKTGGKLVKTPTYDHNDNTQIRRVDVDLYKNGSARISAHTHYRGLQYENVDFQLQNSIDEKRKWLLRNIDLNGVTINDFDYQHQPDIIPGITESLTLESRSYASVTGDRLFLMANALNQQSYVPKNLKERRTDVVIRTPYTDIDSVYITLPAGYHVEHLPDEMSLKTRFGEYYATFKLTEKGLLYVRRNVRWQGRHEPSTYGELRSMMKQIAKFDRTKVVLAGNT